MHSLEKVNRINAANPPQPHPLYWHPRIVSLRVSVNRLPVDDYYRRRLRKALYQYADQLVERPFFKPSEGWDDLEALQLVTLSDWMEESLRAMTCKASQAPR